jgi:hypothetical protein
MKNKNKETLKDFVKFCEEHKEYRFWQALYAWVGAVGIGGIWVNGEDPFYWEGKLK